MSTPQAQAQAQVTLSLPILRRGQHAGEPPVERLQFMLNFVKGADDLDDAAGSLAAVLPARIDIPQTPARRYSDRHSSDRQQQNAE